MTGHLILLNLLGGVALLVWGTTMVRMAVLDSFRGSLRHAIALATKGRLRSAATGIAVAALLQSSTATALLLSGFVTGGLVALPAALAVMLGADLGTTLVVQALAFDLSALTPVLLLAGVALAVSGAGRLRDIGRAILGFGLILQALGMIGTASEPLRDSPLTGLLFDRLAGDPVLAIAVAAAMTWLFHSSVAFIVFVISLAGAGIVPPGLAVLLVLGGNIGAGLVPLSLALGAPAAARRVFYGNLAARALGVLALAPFAAALAPHLAALAGDTARQLAHLHTLFNVGLLAVFLPLAGVLARALQRLLPDAPEKGRARGVDHLDPGLLDRPQLALTAATREVMRMADTVELMLQLAMQPFSQQDSGTADRIRALEAEVDSLHEAVKLYLARLLRHPLDQRQGEQVIDLLMFTINLENVGDIIDRGLLAMAEKKRRLDLTFTDAGWTELLAFHERTTQQMRLAMTVFVRRDAGMARELVTEKDALRALEARSRGRHLDRLRAGDPESIRSSALHLDVLRDLKRIIAHLTSAAYPILEEHGQLRASRLRSER